MKRNATDVETPNKKAAARRDLNSIVEQRRRNLHPIVEECRCDASTYFFVLPRDCLLLLSHHLPHRLGIIRNPALLSWHSTHKLSLGALAVCFGMDHELVAPRTKAICRFDMNGRELNRTRGLDLDISQWCTMDSKRRLYISQCSANKVIVLHASGALLYAMDVNAPTGLALSTFERLLYVCSQDRTAPHSVHVFNTTKWPLDNNYLIGRIGEGVLTNPSSVAVLSTKEIVVGIDETPSQIFVFNSNGTSVRSLGNDIPLSAFKLEVDANDHIYVVDHIQMAVLVFSAYGVLLHKLTDALYGDRALSVAIDRSGVVAVVRPETVDLFCCDDGE